MSIKRLKRQWLLLMKCSRFQMNVAPKLDRRTMSKGPEIDADCNHTSKAHPIVCEFLNKANQLFVTQGAHVGLRKEHNGILLLDSALQTTIQADSDVVLVEMPHAEVKLLLQYLKSSKTTDSWKKVIEALEDGLKKSKLPNEQAYHRFTKWATVQVWLPQFDFHKVVVGVVKELMQGYQNIPELSVAAALMDRLKRLLPESVPLWLGNTNTDESRRVVNRALMFSEVARRETFDLWPHMDYKWAHPDAMAQAGFYHQPVSPGDDRALCFTCHVCLVCWEPTDEPWSEHERHSSNCPYVQGGATQNVPLSATLATAPAQKHGDGKEPITCVSSSSSCPHLMATSTKHGHICIWDVSDQLTLACEIVVQESDITHSKNQSPVGEVVHAWGEKNNSLDKPGGNSKDKSSDAEEEEVGDDPPLVLFGKLVISGGGEPQSLDSCKQSYV
ncbi:putative baculoviral IAP repeat-containing protein 6 [Apostichopus japonicus]|uniref:Putative baculoviral IAP repeat-containing protein 6 n=1 Tax=Stichopus japonicus TaxID=307972 RepID=A0A2G8JT38_STIJA|nr:putative baculoviral IAP repeat-containing protein 6 [Apostichopus japonicus]